MPTTENDRRNLQQPVLDKPAMPDHDRRSDPGMHSALPTAEEMTATGPGALDEREVAPPDQEFEQILKSGAAASEGLIPDDPNNWLTSDADKNSDQDPEDRGESLPDALEGDKH